MSTYATWLPAVLRAAGLNVVTYPGWETRGAPGVATHPQRRYPGGGFVDLRAVVWHHDASPRGNTPGIPESMLSRWEVAAAQLWVDRAGTWHVLAAGVAWHAGAVLAGMPGNWTSLGVETDHTVGEDWPPEQLRSLRSGTAAILTRIKRPASAGLHFHKSICDPPGRKVDPDGLTLSAERQAVAALMASPHNAAKDGLDMASLEDVKDVAGPGALLSAPIGRTKIETGDPLTVGIALDRTYKMLSALTAATKPDAIAAALKTALANSPAEADVDVDELARKIVLELGKDPAA